MTVASTRRVVTDSSGRYWFDPDSLAHTYAYNGSGQLTTDTVTDGSSTWVKTYTWSGSTMTNESEWVKQ